MTAQVLGLVTWRAGLVVRKGWQTKRQVSPRGGTCLAPPRGRASQPQCHVVLRSDPVQGQGCPSAINIIIFIIIECINIKNIIICVINIIISIIVQRINIKKYYYLWYKYYYLRYKYFFIVIIESINIKNNIICVLNIMIFIIIQIININNTIIWV